MLKPIWWKVFPYDEKGELWPHVSFGGAWALLWAAALVAVARLAGSAALPHLVGPIALATFSLWASRAAGTLGMSLTAPILMYGWVSMVYALAHAGGGLAGATVEILGCYLLLMLVAIECFVFPTFRSGMALLAMAEGLAMLVAWVGLGMSSLPATADGELSLADAVRACTIAIEVVTVMAILHALVDAYGRYLSHKDETAMMALWSVGSFAAGCCVALVCGLVAGPVGVLGALLSLVAGVGLIVVMRWRGLGSMRALLFGLTALPLLGLAVKAPGDYLYPLRPVTTLLAGMSDGALGWLLGAGAALAQGWRAVFGGLGGLLGSALGFDMIALQATLLHDVFSLNVGVFVIMCAGGAAVWAYERRYEPQPAPEVGECERIDLALVIKESAIRILDGLADIPVDTTSEDSAMSKKPVFGLWWKALEPDGSFSVFPKRSWFWTLAAYLPLVSVLIMAPWSLSERLALPILLISLNLGATYLLGIVGTDLTAPAIVYGWTSLLWVLLHSRQEIRADASQVALLIALGIVILSLIFFFLAHAMQRDMNWVYSLAWIGIFMCFVPQWLEELKIGDYQLSQWLGTLYGLSIAVAVLLMLINLYRIVRMHGAGEAMKDDLTSLVQLLGLGLVPVLVAALLQGAGPVAVLVAVLACLGGEAFVVRRFVLSSSYDMGLVLFPLLLVATAALAVRAPVADLPAYDTGALLFSLCRDNGVLQWFSGGITAFVGGLSILFSGPIASVLSAVLGLQVPASSGLVSVFVLHAGLILVTSLMGIVASAMEVAGLVQPLEVPSATSVVSSSDSTSTDVPKTE